MFPTATVEDLHKIFKHKIKGNDNISETILHWDFLKISTSWGAIFFCGTFRIFAFQLSVASAKSRKNLSKKASAKSVRKSKGSLAEKFASFFLLAQKKLTSQFFSPKFRLQFPIPLIKLHQKTVISCEKPIYVNANSKEVKLKWKDRAQQSILENPMLKRYRHIWWPDQNTPQTNHQKDSMHSE